MNPTLEQKTQVWTAVCTLEQIPLNGGVCALVGGQQVAVFRLPENRLYALSNRDPFMNANVLSRGIVGTRVVNGYERPKVASPLKKQNFDLETGVCLDDPTVTVAVYPVKLEGRQVLVGGA